MSSAIEVLKKFVKDTNLSVIDDVPYTNEVEKAIGEALLALEEKQRYFQKWDSDIKTAQKLEHLKEWLEKEIKDCIEMKRVSQYDYNKQAFEFKKNILKEILEKVGEQK